MVMAVDKSKWNTNVKVSQKTIDEIKKMGMAKALKTVAGASAASKNDASAKAWVEGVKRLYGANRVAEAVKAPASKPATRSGVSSMDSAYASSKPKATTSKAKPAAKPAAKGSTTSNPLTAAFNKLSPYGNKNQKFKSPISRPTQSDVDAEMAKRYGLSLAEYRKRRASRTLPKR
jgi:hypothetical protein